jgi:3',5'-cyclic-AMP phosphodiesterase
MKVLQFTDPHLYGRAEAKLRGVQTDASLRAIMSEAFAAVPDYDLVLVTGDLVQDDPLGYLRFRELFAGLKQPVLCIPGNHDEPEAMRAALCAAPFQINGSYEAGHWQFLMLDSFNPGHVGGRLSRDELDRLQAGLASNPAHAMVCLHHHPVKIGSRWLDTVGLANADEFWEILDSHAHVRAVVWGHVHQEYAAQRGRIGLYATPSTGAQFLPDSENFALDARPPAYRSFELSADGRLETEVSWLEPQALRRAASR